MRKKGAENLYEDIMAENNQISLAWRNRHPGLGSSGKPKQDEPERTTPRCLMIKISKFKERILKATSEKQIVTYKGNPTGL